MNKTSLNQTQIVYERTPEFKIPNNTLPMYSTPLHPSNSVKCSELCQYNTPNIPLNLATLSLEDYDKTPTTDISTRRNRYSRKSLLCELPVSDCSHRRNSYIEWCHHDFINDDHWRIVRYYFVESKRLQMNKKAYLDDEVNHSTRLYRIYIDENGNKYSFF
ncbi:unnamed protein product [Schistosoma margrebowiei]|uniref:Uncharacterized protein n=1 Tax=Schistosoma margrebowiei TaxID=48269 RepID=A0A183M6D5_9TREM|nr:unnamed protein product [Schistosoma margrebowiei]